MKTDTPPEIQHADPVARRRVLIAVLVIVVLGSIGWAALQAWLDGLRSLPAAEAQRSLATALQLLVAHLGLGVAGLAIYILFLASRTRRALRYPPPGSSVVRDTPVVVGDRARVRATLLRIVGCAMIGLAALLVFVAHRLVTSLA